MAYMSRNKFSFYVDRRKASPSDQAIESDEIDKKEEKMGELNFAEIEMPKITAFKERMRRSWQKERIKSLKSKSPIVQELERNIERLTPSDQRGVLQAMLSLHIQKYVAQNWKKLYKQLAAEIWDTLIEDTKASGYKFPLEFIANLDQADEIESLDGLKILLVNWMAGRVILEIKEENLKRNK
jgi:hypothetical protein